MIFSIHRFPARPLRLAHKAHLACMGLMLLICLLALSHALPALAESLPFAVSGKVTLVDFTAVWCGPCKIQKPIVQSLAKELGDRAAVVIVDVEQDQRARNYKVSAIPTLVFHDATGKVRFRYTGVMPREAILAKMEELGMPATNDAIPATSPAKSPPSATRKNTLTLD